MLNPLEMERYIAATAKRADLRVVWENDNQPRTNAEQMFLPRITDAMTEQAYKELQHSVRHEVGHQLHTDLELPIKHNLDPSKSLLAAMWNQLDDQRVDYLDAQEYEGDRLISNDIRTQQTETIVESLRELPDDDESANTFLPIMAMNNKLYSDFYPSMRLHQEALENEIGRRPKAKALYDKLTSGDYENVLRNIRKDGDRVRGTQATFDLAKRIFEEVYGGDAEKELERLEQEAAGKGKPKKKEEKEEGKAKGKDKGDGGSDDKGKEDGKEEGTGASDEAELGNADGEPDDTEGPPVNVDYKEFVPEPRSHMRSPMRGMHIDYSNYTPTRNPYQVAQEKDYQINDYTKKNVGGEHRYLPRIQDTVANTSASFAHKVRTILQVRARDHYQYGLKRGKLHGSALYRVTMRDAPGFNERVFKRKQENNILDAAVSVLIDGSGSMGGEKYCNAAATGVMLNDTIGNTLHIPVEICSFSTPECSPWDGTGCAIYIHRKFGDKRVSRDDIMRRFAAAGDCLANNPDGDAIMWMFDRLVVRPEKRKLLIVCSDGSPCGGHRSGDLMGYTRHVVKNIETQSPVSIVGIGIMDRNVSLIYKEHYTIKAAHELETALLSVIENKLK